MGIRDWRLTRDELRVYFDGLAYSGDTRTDVVAVFRQHGFEHTIGHSARVSAEARRLALLYRVDAGGAEIAGWLHDISAVIPNTTRIGLARQLGIDVLPEEERLPMIVHQKLSAVIASDVFGITDAGVLSAIGCHTTLKANASVLDKVVFVADKIKWDQAGDPPYLDTMTSALEHGIDHAVWCYLQYLWDMRERLPVAHPWFVQAYAEYALRAW